MKTQIREYGEQSPVYITLVREWMAELEKPDIKYYQINGQWACTDSEEEYAESILQFQEEEQRLIAQFGDRLCVQAINEGGFNSTAVDLEDVLKWVAKNQPELLNRIMEESLI